MSKSGKRARAKMNTDIGVLSGGSSECGLPTGTMPTGGFAVGTKNIPALFWNPMLSINGKKAIKAKRGSGND
jgi:hypothetical protein